MRVLIIRSFRPSKLQCSFKIQKCRKCGFYARQQSNSLARKIQNIGGNCKAVSQRYPLCPGIFSIKEKKENACDQFYRILYIRMKAKFHVKIILVKKKKDEEFNNNLNYLLRCITRNLIVKKFHVTSFYIKAELFCKISANEEMCANVFPLCIKLKKKRNKIK